MRNFRVKYLLLFLVLLALPILTVACPLCQAGATKRTASAYKETTALLALLPIAGGGGIFYWLYSKGREAGKKKDG